MNIRDILRLEEYRLPINRGNGNQIKDYIENEILKKYQTAISSSTNLLDGISSAKYRFTDKTYQDTINEVIDVFLKTLDQYFQGKSAWAYFYLDSFFSKIGIYNYFKTYVYPHNTSFYRMRKHDGNYPLSCNEMFHIPFDYLEAVSTQRYSIPGYPALYLGNSLYICWEELNRPDSNEMQCILFKNIIPIKVLDLDWTEYYMSLFAGTISDDTLIEYGILWPLFAICNMIVPKKNIMLPFKGEYIFPQMVMQSLQNQTSWPVYAIRYPSSKVKYDTNYPNNRFHNIVIPVNKIEKTGYCSILKTYFKASDVEIWNLREIINHTFSATGMYKNNDVEAISLNQNNFIEYKQTKFFDIESYFDGIPDPSLKRL